MELVLDRQAALKAHIAKERERQNSDPPDERPVHAISAIPYRFRAARKEDFDNVHRRIEQVCESQTWRSEMTRTYLSQNYSWRVHDGDLLMPDGIACFDKNLIVTGDVVCEAYMDNVSVLIVLGSLRCAEMYSMGGLCVLGDTIIGGTMLHHYNDWAFECMGKVSARAFVIEDKMTAFSRERSVFEYFSDDACPLDEEPADAKTWLALDVERDPGEHVQVLCNAYANGRDPLPDPPAFSERVKQFGEFSAWQRAIAEGRLDHAAALAKLADPAWALEMATLWPRRVWLGELLANAVAHVDERVRMRLASRLTDAGMLGRLAHDASPAVRAEAALNAACPEPLWPALAQDVDATVRASLAYGRYGVVQALPVELQSALASDIDAIVRRAVAVLPGLDPACATLLRADTDAIVRKRVSATQPMDEATLLGQLADPDASVRAGLASAAVWRCAPFNVHAGLRTQVIQRLLLDSCADVRKAAATWMPPPFVEAHEHGFATDTVPEVRALAAAATRNVELQHSLAEDSEEAVRLAVIGNPHAHADVLTHLARELPSGGFFQLGAGIAELASHPRLPAEAAGILHDRIANSFGQLFAEQPNLPVRAMVARLCHDLPYSPGEWEYEDCHRCLAVFPDLELAGEIKSDQSSDDGLGTRLMRAGIGFPRRWYQRPLLFAGLFVTMLTAALKVKRGLRQAEREGKLAPLDDSALDALFHHMLDSKLHSLNKAALGNARCPPERLAQYVTNYLAKETGETDYAIEYVAANPALPCSVMTHIVERLIKQHDYELRKGFMRNPSAGAEHLKRLIADGHGDTPDEARQALWSWHGEWVE